MIWKGKNKEELIAELQSAIQNAKMLAVELGKAKLTEKEMELSVDIEDALNKAEDWISEWVSKLRFISTKKKKG